MDTPEQVLERATRDIDALRRRGFGPDADRLGKLAGEFGDALDPIRLVDEDDAMLRSGKTRAWLRSRFDGWEQVGAAAWIESARHYRLCVLPTRLGRAEGAADAERYLKAAS